MTEMNFSMEKCLTYRVVSMEKVVYEFLSN